MTTEGWKSAINQLANQGAGMVQFIGGEPLLHPDLSELVNHALGRGIQAEVYSNLSHVTEPMWKTLSQEGVHLATSYYSPDAGQHEAITKGRGSHRRTRANVQEAVSRGIPLRVGIIGVTENQDIEEAIAELVELGVDRKHIGVDYMRGVGRGVPAGTDPEVTSQLCGNCADGVLAVLPDGSVQPCVFSRQPEFRVGNIQDQSLEEILRSDEFRTVQRGLRRVFRRRRLRRIIQRGLRVFDPVDCRPLCNPNCRPSTTGDPDCRPDRKCFPTTPPKGLMRSLIPQAACSPKECAPDDTCNPDLGECGPDKNWCVPRTQKSLLGGVLRVLQRGGATEITGCRPDPCVPDAEKCHPKTPPCNPCIPNHLCTPDKEPGCRPRNREVSSRAPSA